MFGVSLMITIIVELAVILSLKRLPLHGKSRGKGILLVVLVNVLTNPPAVWLCWLAGLYMPKVPEIAVQLTVELAVVLVEACIYRSFAHKSQWEIDRPVRLAVTANVCSWLLGEILLTIRNC